MVILLLGAAYAATIEGTVVAADDGAALKNAIVVAYDLRLSYVYDQTSVTGTYSLRGLHAGTWRVRVVPADTANYLTRFYPDTRDYCDAGLIVVALDDALTGIDLSLQPGATLGGRLLDSAGSPVAGATVEVSGIDDENDGVSREAQTDSDGVFTVRGLEGASGETYGWTCRVDADDFPAQYLGPAYDIDDASSFITTLDSPTDIGDQTLLDGILVRGTLTGPDGPVYGASVHVYATSQVVSVLSETDGSYEAAGLPPGHVLSWASADGLAMTYYPDNDRPTDWLEAPDEGDIVEGADLVLPAQSTFAGQLVAEDGAATPDLSGVTVLLYNDDGTVGFGARPESDGSFEIDRLFGGDYRLFAYASDEGFGDEFITDSAGAEKVFDVAAAANDDEGMLLMPRRSSISGTLVDDAGAPVYGGYVIAYPDDETLSTRAAVSDIDGVFRLGGLAPGRWTVKALYSPYCDSDPGYVAVYWPGDAIYEAYGSPLDIRADETYTGVTFVLPRDDDHDAMSDGWEADNGLDTRVDDGDLDPDEDGYTNLEEYLLGTDPNDSSKTRVGCGCATSLRGQGWWVAGLGLLLFARRRRS